jgi:hypothetical protein
MQRMVMAAAVVATLLLFVPAEAASDAFWQHWGDGKAEIDGYALVEPRYGELRDGTAVLVFVTEDFSDSARVKADPGKHPASDVYPVLKLNFQREFQTGIYHYNTLTSTFAKTELDAGAYFVPVKSSFSAQEWCGHVYQQWLVRDGRLVGISHSYFDGEGDATLALAWPAGGVLEDELPILVRGLRGEWLSAGQTRTVPFLRSSLRTRLQHLPPAWGEATVSRATASVLVPSVLGKVPAFVYTVAERGGDTITFTVEESAPHRLLAWHSSSGESGTLTGSVRLAYWQMNGKRGEAALPQLGLKPRR